MRHLTITLAAVVLPAVLGAQQAPTSLAEASAPPPSAEQGLAEMRSTLRNLVVAQERFFMDHLSYTTDLAALRLSPSGKRDRPKVFVVVTHAGGRAWRAIAQHGAFEGKSCVVFVGDPADFPMPATEAESLRPTLDQEGEPVCDKL